MALAKGRVLEVGAAEGVLSCRLNLRGLESFVVEPSPVMLERARDRVQEHGARVGLVRGISEENRHTEVDWGPPVGGEAW